MVCRLVEQQQLRLTQQYLGQLDAHLPAVAELVHLARHVFVVEAKANENLFRLAFGRVASDESHPLVECAHPLAKLLIAIAFIISALRQLILQLCQLFLNLMILLESCHRLLEDGLGRMDILLLRQVADGDIVRHHHAAVRRLLEAGDDADEGGLAGTVLTHQTYAVLLADKEIDVGEEVLTGEMYAQILN